MLWVFPPNCSRLWRNKTQVVAQFAPWANRLRLPAAGARPLLRLRAKPWGFCSIRGQGFISLLLGRRPCAGLLGPAGPAPPGLCARARRLVINLPPFLAGERNLVG